MSGTTNDLPARVIDLDDYRILLSKLEKLKDDKDITEFAKWTIDNIKKGFLIKEEMNAGSSNWIDFRLLYI